MADERILEPDPETPERYRTVVRVLDHVEWNFTREQLADRIARLQAELDRWKGYLDDIDTGRV
jgi:hypothetical protein